jgi:GntR family transcriptional regulator of arabinose operon
MGTSGRNNRKSWEVLMVKLSREILAGRYPPEEPLPGEYPLCERFDCSRTTVRRAMVELEKKGLVYRRHGKGTFAHPVDNRNLPPVGLLIRKPERLTGDYFVDLIRGCNSYLNAIGSQITIITQPPNQWPKRLYESLAGVIVIPVGITQSDIAVLTSNACPHVIVMESLLSGPHVKMDIEKISFDLTTLLLQKGHRRIALISGHGEHSDNFKRKGISEALQQYGISLDGLDDIQADYDVANAQKAAETLLSQKNRPTAIIAFDDRMAIGIVQTAKKIGLNLPRQLSIVGFNNSPMGSLIDPPLTTVHFPIHDAGRAAARMIAGQYLKNIKIKTIVQYPHIVNRKSIASPYRKSVKISTRTQS